MALTSRAKWHLGDKPVSYPIEHGFDEMRNSPPTIPASYTYPDTSKWFSSVVPFYNPQFNQMFK